MAIASYWSNSELEPVDVCPVCRGARRRLLYEGVEDRVFRCAPGRWSYYQCEECCSAYLDPRPIEESIGKAYGTYLTHRKYVKKVNQGGSLQQVLKGWCEEYRQKKYGGDVKGFAAGAWIIPAIPSLKGLIDSEMRHLPQPPSSGGTLLDIGCGNGDFLAKARGLGWGVKGIDFDPKAVAVCRAEGFDVVCGGVSTIGDWTELYDVVTISHVVEHVYDPGALLSNVFRMLKPGGKLWLETPNIESLGKKIYGRDWFHLDPPRHLVLFSLQAMVTLLKKYGFKKIKNKFRGLNTSSTFAASEALKSGADPLVASRRGRPPLSDIFAEMYEMVMKGRREFVTLIAEKPVEPPND